ncbi:ArsR/SmtB family transcription factor [Streptomyces litchfieldiae]|uniref:Winged helix-turn-helix domain-containing protein n=1 Tax=Streptomyces litchfieldiae TaxID=3075543 RepID=A0ABU2N1E8_9ACTN|nr:winged helix-turn-helix domain-containing protein [Streptomyces sp. DSM 44938]MDT0347747.1 winged helix-turn-helix domain-containing protein [Streptomyces sp. DSM 44938]
MPNNTRPDYDLADVTDVSDPAQLHALASPVRNAILELLLERAATVSELAGALDRPKSTVAHHVSVLVDAHLLKVVRTRRVRAIDERFYGRTARIFRVGTVSPTDGGVTPYCNNDLATAAAESVPAHQADQLSSIVRHVRIPQEQAREFWARVLELANDYAQLPRGGDVVYGFAAGLYPTDYPALPEAESAAD